jgi:carboxymethylenebutenolidase
MAMKDRWVQAEVNDLLERRLSPNPLVAIHKYPGADHAFARSGGKTYCKPEADRAALSLTLGFFKQHLAKWIACGASIRNFGGVRVRAPKLILHRF